MGPQLVEGGGYHGTPTLLDLLQGRERAQAGTPTTLRAGTSSSRTGTLPPFAAGTPRCTIIGMGASRPPFLSFLDFLDTANPLFRLECLQRKVRQRRRLHTSVRHVCPQLRWYMWCKMVDVVWPAFRKHYAFNCFKLTSRHDYASFLQSSRKCLF